jgi:hypothetical protein
MSDAKLIRESDHLAPRTANFVEKAVGLKPLVERPPSPENAGPQPAGVSPTVVQQLVRWIPTETITLYVAFIALLNPVMAPTGKKLCEADVSARVYGVLAFAIATMGCGPPSASRQGT